MKGHTAEKSVTELLLILCPFSHSKGTIVKGIIRLLEKKKYSRAADIQSSVHTPTSPPTHTKLLPIHSLIRHSPYMQVSSLLVLNSILCQGLFRGFTTVHFSGIGLLAPRSTSNLEHQGLHLSGMCVSTKFTLPPAQQSRSKPQPPLRNKAGFLEEDICLPQHCCTPC